MNFFTTRSLPDCITNLNIDFERTLLTEKKMQKVIRYIAKKSWEDVAINERFKKKSTGLKVGFSYIGEGKFVINLTKKIAYGGYKKIKWALLYDQINQKAQVVINACSHMKNQRQATRYAEMERRIADISKEAPNRFVHIYAVIYQEGGDKQSLIQDPYDSDLRKIINNYFFLNNQKITRSGRYEIALQIMEDLAFLHSKNYAHGDITSANILVRITDNTITAHLHDFGSVYTPDEQEEYYSTRNGTLCSWPKEAWMAYITEEIPKKEAAFKRDIWAMGLILKELIAPEIKIPWLEAELLNQRVVTDFRNRHYVSKQCIEPFLSLFDTPIDHDPYKKEHQLIVACLSPAPENRPSAEEALTLFKRIDL